VKYALIEQFRDEFSVVTLCSLLEVSRSGFYAAMARPASRRSTEDIALRQKIVEAHEQQKGIPGAFKCWQLLKSQGVECGKHRVARLRKDAGLQAKRTARFRVMGKHQHTEPPAPDLVKRQFTVAAPGKVWVSDITTIRTCEGWIHVAIVLDLFARLVIGWAIDKTQAATLPIAALRMAVAQRKPSAGLICHSDQGSVYGSRAYRQVLADHELRPSMSRRGNCHDNAVAESFFSNLKNELTHHTVYGTRQEAKEDISEYIETYYNRERLHQTLGYRTPAAVDASYQSA
jgi:putative transposase